MKKLLLLLVIISLSYSCSSDDDDTSEDSFYIEINVMGETHRHNNVSLFSGGEYECETEIDLQETSLGQFEKSNLWIDMFFSHYQNQINFNDYDINNSKVIDKKWNDDYSDVCYDNFDIDIIFVIDGMKLDLDNSVSNFSEIESITEIEETSLNFKYAVKGEFEAMYIKEDGTQEMLTGKYRIPIDVNK